MSKGEQTTIFSYSTSNSPNKQKLQNNLNTSYSSETSEIDNGPEFTTLINGLIKDYCDIDSDNDFNNNFREETSTKAGSPLDKNNINLYNRHNDLFNDEIKFKTNPIKKSESYSFCSLRNFSRFEKNFKNEEEDNTYKIKNSNFNRHLTDNNLNKSSTSLNSVKSLKISENLEKDWQSNLKIFRENSFRNLDQINKESLINNNLEDKPFSYSSQDVSRFYGKIFYN